MSPAKPQIKHALAFIVISAGISIASPGDDEVEAFLRDSSMGQLLEVQLESRLEQADAEEEREEVAQALSELYLKQMRDLDASEPYRAVVVARAKSLVLRMAGLDMYELRLELLAEDYLAHENAVELHQLRLLGESNHREALRVFEQTHRELNRLLASAVPELGALERRRASSRTSERQAKAAAEAESLRRVTSFGQYYLGWTGYGIAVLQDIHTGRDSIQAFGWLLGLEGDTPQSKDISLAAMEYDHVSRSAIGVAMCHAQSAKLDIAESWLESIIAQSTVSEEVVRIAQLKLARVHALQGDWYKTNVEASSFLNQHEDVTYPVSDARFLALQVLDSGESTTNKDAQRLVTFCVNQLVEQREIGQIVELQRRYADQAFLGDGFVTSYALALAQLEQVESDSKGQSLGDVVKLFQKALEADDVGDYPQHRDDCMLKLAYVHVRNQKPTEALKVCQRVLEGSTDEQAIEEAHWLQIAALDLQLSRSGKDSSDELEQAVAAYLQQYASSRRAQQLVLRFVSRGFIDQQVALDTLREASDNEEGSADAQRLLVQLQYKMLRQVGFQDLILLRDTRALVEQLVADQDANQASKSNIRANVSALQIGIDLALRDAPQDARVALRYIEIAMRSVDAVPGLGQIVPELLSQQVLAQVSIGDVDDALATISMLATHDATRAEEAKIVVLNALMQRWEKDPSKQSARKLVEIGASVIDRVVPPEPSSIGVQQSSLIERVADAGVFLHAQTDDQSMLMLASRLSSMLLDRGAPSELGLRRAAQIGELVNDDQLQLNAWLRLLAAYPGDDERWFEARFKSFEILVRVDRSRAVASYQQYKVLNPSGGIEPWGRQIEDLFAEINGAATSSGGQP